MARLTRADLAWELAELKAQLLYEREETRRARERFDRLADIYEDTVAQERALLDLLADKRLATEGVKATREARQRQQALRAERSAGQAKNGTVLLKHVTADTVS